jgi:hypothetical protein
MVPNRGRARSGMLRSVLIVLIVLGALTPLRAQSPQEAQQAAEQSIRRLGLQTTLPRGPEPVRITIPGEFVWLAAALGIGLLLYMIWEMLPALGFRIRGRWDGDDDGAEGTQQKPPEVVLMAADELAKQGRFVEAMHVLLLQALADIRRGLDEQHADSLTSREILRSTRLSEQGRALLRDIITRVEWTYFGRHPAAQADYAACRDSFNSLARTLHGTAAA